MRILQTLILIFTLAASLSVSAERIKDVSVVEGVRSNQLIGYGLVVGLPGTGEQSRFTEQSFKAMLNSFGITLPGNLKPKIKNVAAVAVHADLPPFVKPGQSIDVTVSSIGSAGSLRGGTLLQTFLKGVDGNVYAIAQGSMIVGGLGAEGLDGSRVVINTPTVGRIPNGGMVERAVKSPFTQGDHITFNLNRPDFTTAKRLADTINGLVGPNSASALDAASVRVIAPRDPSQRVAYLSTLENLEFKPADTSAKIIVNSRTGTIVIGKDVKLQPAAITHGGLTVTIAEQTNVSQPQPLTEADAVVTRQSIVDVDQDDSRAFVFDPGSSLDDLVRAINAVGAAPGDLMAILEALKEAGAIHGQLVVI
ncbi:flagellar basal body P-ring protein FlgI [Pseudoalteromonas luteoviolacea]|uniref:Flagellar P-ring protein n=1 Tax=Pseudoalteromonas luteoviolacea S4054 TaxID=1129367 RepID=A0A0F6A713_9GAMM|nr:flagellar basal body P-ring protein FlgI [Pseudoalteromonas luteoviolacea]AOT07438.1 flagellar biosynthesis protein FlgI [Pseudoalteromonas luteoviolacea]AOT12354.1 flagellar biosynthesis protein FlgI [Pseudoalteromonas luteoviolacea]AOT17267.1 flagellar biosynthesis protein FlgI [Pseudoalteromonas luteoviolacea]KKE81950.1 flagellar P-ring protein FlgI [Pseudoalteromonas luteoviolacea S4054]KZN74144.1 flagellar P-ring protein FlgI [Pseudoalteromonas luteoviolacea S4047-1]